jgi:lipoprotein-anchoring transpeptidase ErfK/SrfK
MSKHRQTKVRPRYGRLASAGASVAVTAIALLGGTGVLPVSSGGAAAQASNDVSVQAAPRTQGAQQPQGGTSGQTPKTKGTGLGASADSSESRVDPKLDTALPADSGTGKRVVFSQSRQRVWLVSADGDEVLRTYPVSGSTYDNLHPGTFNVYSRSEDAWGVDDSGSMKYFVRFTQGDTGAAIGFHDIPIKDGRPIQTEAQLGTPMSHGCIRQRRADAIALWKFAPLGTTVVVTV